MLSAVAFGTLKCYYILLARAGRATAAQPDVTLWAACSQAETHQERRERARN